MQTTGRTVHLAGRRHPTRRRRTPVAALAAATLTAALAWTATAAPAPPATTGPNEGIPGFAHVVVLVLENSNYSTSWNAQNAPYLNNTLRPQGVFADHYYATGHVSLDNYIAMISGQPDQPLTGSDCMTVSLWTCTQGQSVMANGRNLPDQLEALSPPATWKGYMDSMPSPCFHEPYSPTVLTPDPYQGDSTAQPATNYADRHNPFNYFDDIVGNDARCQAHVRPYGELATDIANDAVPQFAFITPDTCHDGHDATCAGSNPPVGGISEADAWLSQNVPSLLSYLDSHNGLLLITFDENGFSDTSNAPGCCSGGPAGVLPGFGGRIGLLALGPTLTANKVVSTPYDHMSLLRTIEDSFGITEHLNNAASASAMADLFTP